MNKDEIQQTAVEPSMSLGCGLVMNKDEIQLPFMICLIH